MDRDTLDRLLARAERAGIFLDFDGTLSEIARTPDAARAVPGAGEVLGWLAERFGLVAIVSGRLGSEVEERLGLPPGVRVFGLYGGEAGVPASDVPEELLARVREAAAGLDGALVEEKGPNVAVHYRQVVSPTAREELLGAIEPLASEAGMELLEGKQVIELAPAGASTKGRLLEREAAGLEAVLYAGDDLADLDAFAAVERLETRGVQGVRVAVRSAETPAELIDAADVVVDGPEGLLDLLRELVS